MARLTAASLLPLVLLLISSLPSPSMAAPKKPPAAAARREDIPFIKCQVCEKLAHQIHSQVKNKEAQISPKKVSEFQIIEIAENVCNLKKEEADWILKIDIVEKGDKLELVEQGIEGLCNSECKTIERACQEVMGYSDTDVAEFLFKSKPSVDLLVNFLCNDLTKACSAKRPPVPKSRAPGESFVPKPSKDAEMEKIMRSMEGMPGAPNMKMYSREDLMNNNFGGETEEEEDDGDDDDDDGDNFPGNLGKVLKQKEPSKKNLKQTILQGVADTRAKIKKHINTASQKITKWWKGKRTGGKPPKGSKNEL